ncbi:hypothetical protein ABK040_008314 [Willaertia magna]
MRTIKYSICILGAALVGKQTFSKAATELFEGKIIPIKSNLQKYSFQITLQQTKYDITLITLYDTGFTTEEKNELKNHMDGFILMFDITNRFTVERVKNYMKLLLTLLDNESPVLAEMNKNSWQQVHKNKRKNTGQFNSLNNNGNQNTNLNNLNSDESKEFSKESTKESLSIKLGSSPTNTNEEKLSDVTTTNTKNRESNGSDDLDLNVNTKSNIQNNKTLSINENLSANTPNSPTANLENSTMLDDPNIKQIKLLPIILVGNKTDSENGREVQTKDIIKLSDKYNCPFIESSATFKKKGIEAVFIELIKRIDKIKQENSAEKNVNSGFFSSFSSAVSRDEMSDSFSQMKRLREQRRQQSIDRSNL